MIFLSVLNYRTIYSHLSNSLDVSAPGGLVIGHKNNASKAKSKPLYHYLRSDFHIMQHH